MPALGAGVYLASTAQAAAAALVTLPPPSDCDAMTKEEAGTGMASAAATAAQSHALVFLQDSPIDAAHAVTLLRAQVSPAHASLAQGAFFLVSVCYVLAIEIV